ncbi:hypothetical protein FB547_11340 [Variovorax beijingensis]|uniref:Uncharacterized protein n=1 Tax=Variovorax beijingensis TaxID=2496117 RepID=A0A561BBI6_9BURK|nr:hypothetical protein FB547_11340 [Variovorax beijingensis]
MRLAVNGMSTLRMLPAFFNVNSQGLSAACVIWDNVSPVYLP